jgi:hypothetical protein
MANGWTSERKAKQAALIRQWRSWQQATGPKTPKGKFKASHNAYKGVTWWLLRALSQAMREPQKALKRAQP